MARKCCVKNCDFDGKLVTITGLPLHKFPKDNVSRTTWIINCGYNKNYRPTPGQLVCHKHFKREDYEVIKGHKFYLKKGAVPTVFHDYDKHPDPLGMPVKTSSNTSYPQEDLDLINSKIMSIDRTESPSLIDSCGETCHSRPESSADSLNHSELPDDLESDSKFETSHDEEASNVIDSNGMEKMEHPDEPPAEPPPLSPVMEQTNLPCKVPTEIEIKEEPRDRNNSRDSSDVGKSQQKLVSRDGLEFYCGARLEAKDFHDKWYPARVVEVDWTEREVLIHFDKWNSRFDEWIPIDSSRLRELQAESSEQTWVIPHPNPTLTPDTKMREFTVGERILATWADGRKYPAKVNSVLGEDRYDVLFDDGYAKIVKSSKMTKIAGTSETKQIPMEADSYIGSKQERRDKKRKHSVMDLFSRKKAKPEVDKSLKKDEVGEVVENFQPETSEPDPGPLDDSGTELLKGFESPKPRTRNHRRKRQSSKPDTDQEDDVGPEWIDGEPQGIESFTVDGNNGTRRSIIVPDKRLPPGWQKHFTQRRTGSSAGKWDVLFMHKITGKKFRSKSDIRTFFETQQQVDFDPEMFDFCIHRRKRSGAAKVKPETPVETQKKIKTLLPKTKPPPPPTENLLLTPATPQYPTVPIMPSTTPVDDSAVFIGGLRVEMEDSAYKCPKDGCLKTFRKENFLQMHIKHYHPEFSKFLGSTPNVAELAYARTIGESIVDTTPKSRLFEKRRSLQEKLVGGSFVHSPGQASFGLPSPLSAPGSEVSASEQTNGIRDDVTSKFEMMSPVSMNSLDHDEDLGKRTDANCAMSPGALFDMKIREEKTQVGIKTLLPVRPSNESQRTDRSKSLDDALNIEKGKGQRKRQLSEYSSDASTKSKKRQGMQEFTDDYGDLDDSAVDAEGPAGLVYRFSRRKSDPKSDENSQSSQLKDSRLEKSHSAKRHNNDSNDQEDGEGVMMMINGEMVKVEQLRREEIINCTCGFMEEDGLMIQCDLCLCWQHGHCSAIEREKDVPEKYICYTCRHPYRQRASKKYIHDQDWIKEGKLQSLSKRTKNQVAINERTAILKRSYDLVGVLLQIQQVLHSLRVKINIAQTKDHPKLYLWAKNWEKSEILKSNLEPVPVMEIINSDPEPEEALAEIPMKDEQSIELKLTNKDDVDCKPITSDSELMKILEEDSSMLDESEVTCKKEDSASQNEGHILHNALTRSESDEKPQKLEMRTDNEISETVEESKESLNDEKLVVESENVEMKSAVPSQEPAIPLQPFIPEPEAPIDPAECRLRLLEHIEHFQNHIDAHLATIEAQVCVLETMVPGEIPSPEEVIPSPKVQPRTKETIQMLLRDLASVRKLASLC